MNDFGGVKLHGGRFTIALDSAGDMYLTTPSGKRIALAEEDAGMLATDWNHEGVPAVPRAASVWCVPCVGCGSMSLGLYDDAGVLVCTAKMEHKGALEFAQAFVSQLNDIGVPTGECGSGIMPTAPGTETCQ